MKIASTRPQLQEIARSTLLAVQQKTLKVDLKTLTDKTISDLFKMGALQLEGGKCPSTTSNIPLLLNTTVKGNKLTLFFYYIDSFRTV